MEFFYSVLAVCISCCFVIWLLNRPKIITVEKEAKSKDYICYHDFQLLEQLDKNNGDRCVGKVYVSRCTDCGEIKHHEILIKD